MDKKHAAVAESRVSRVVNIGAAACVSTPTTNMRNRVLTPRVADSKQWAADLLQSNLRPARFPLMNINDNISSLTTAELEIGNHNGGGGFRDAEDMQIVGRKSLSLLFHQGPQHISTISPILMSGRSNQNTI